MMLLKELDLHLTNKCNMSCRHCVFSAGERDIREIEFDKIAQCIVDFAEITRGKGIVNLFGGEVLLRKDVFQIIGLIVGLKLSLGLTTNARVPRNMILRLAEYNISRITVDLDGGGPTTHNWLRNKTGDFERLNKAINLFISLGFYISINVVLYKDNINEVEDILKLCRDIDINTVAFYFFTPVGRGVDIAKKMLGPREWISARNRIGKWIDKNNPKFGIVWERAYEQRPFQVDPSLWRCGSRHKETIFVRCDGEVYPCALLEGTSYSLGNLKEERLRNILKNRRSFHLKIKSGCPIVALYAGENKDEEGKFFDDLIYPACPYDYQVLTSKENYHEKYRAY